MPRQIIYFTDDTLQKLKSYIVKKHGSHRALSLTVQEAVNEYLERNNTKESQPKT